MALTAMTSVLSYMRDAGAIVAHQDRNGELFLRLRFDGYKIVPVTEDADNVYFRLVPVVAHGEAAHE